MGVDVETMACDRLYREQSECQCQYPTVWPNGGGIGWLVRLATVDTNARSPEALGAASGPDEIAEHTNDEEARPHPPGRSRMGADSRRGLGRVVEAGQRAHNQEPKPVIMSRLKEASHGPPGGCSQPERSRDTVLCPLQCNWVTSRLARPFDQSGPGTASGGSAGADPGPLIGQRPRSTLRRFPLAGSAHGSALAPSFILRVSPQKQNGTRWNTARSRHGPAARFWRHEPAGRTVDRFDSHGLPLKPFQALPSPGDLSPETGVDVVPYTRCCPVAPGGSRTRTSTSLCYSFSLSIITLFGI
ncbi:hypothetical protein F5Y03DRAFT_405192 [Xylaria venustula]|nr:hypothetical protein F5Y03DRAFT_405192 [Xylaria venustula]